MKRSFDEDTASSTDNAHEYMYKLRGITCEELRKRRRLKEIQIRKEKRNALLDIRRQLRTEVTEFVDSDNFIDKPTLDMMMSGSCDKELAAVKYLRGKIYEVGEPCLYRLAATSLIPLLVELYLRNNEDLKREAAWILINMNNDKNSFKCEVKNTVLPALCNLIKEQHDDLVLAQLLWCLASLIEDSVAGRNFVIENQIVPQIIRICEGHSVVEILRHSVWLISQLFLRITEYTPDITLPMYLAGLHVRIVDLIPIVSPVMRPSIIRIMANITQDTSCYTEGIIFTCLLLVTFFCNCILVLVNQGLLEHLVPLIGTRTIARDVCFIIANISAEGEKMIDTIVNSNIMREITKLLESGDYETRKEVDNKSITLNFIIMHLISIRNVSMLKLKVLIINLTVYTTDFFLEFDNDVAIQLEEMGGKDKLEFLTNSDSIDIHIKAYEVLDKYFYGKEDNLYEMEDTIDSRQIDFNGKVCTTSRQEERDSVDDIINNVLGDGR
uniref:IBB domain-containing protein n=1 Tax=Heterorhabditis bacteriophora TaxID=37862 RepID=A0A1I7XFM5_HETBA